MLGLFRARLRNFGNFVSIRPMLLLSPTPPSPWCFSVWVQAGQLSAVNLKYFISHTGACFSYDSERGRAANSLYIRELKSRKCLCETFSFFFFSFVNSSMSVSLEWEVDSARGSRKNKVCSFSRESSLEIWNFGCRNSSEKCRIKSSFWKGGERDIWTRLVSVR